MAEAKAKKGSPGLKRMFYKVEGGKLRRDKPFCPKCGPGVFLAKHANRVSCGRCGYSEFASK
ncbi:MAG TPA: 30S ribosomal protein S27ae [Thermoplasmata archaeon]